MRLKGFFLMLLLPAATIVRAQADGDIIAYINTYKEMAMAEMQRSGIPAAIKLAQGIHETQAGKSDLVLRSNNHFGIKCKETWTGNRVFHDDDTRAECFRSYTSPAESYADHSDFLRSSPRYASLFRLDPTDYKAWAYGLRKAGYATNIRYAQILIKLIEDYNLEQYTLIAMGRMSPQQEVLASRDQGASLPVVFIDSSSKAITPVSITAYPEGQFTINETPVMFARAGTSLVLLARQYEVSLSRLLDFNDLAQEDVLIEGQLIFLQRKRKTGSTDFHIVQPGETIYSISQAEGLRLESLMRFNHLQAGMEPGSGERLSLRGEAPARPLLTNEREGNDTLVSIEVTTHIVRTRETLYTISKMYGVEATKIKEWNKLDGDHLKRGQELIIYKN